MGFNPCVNISVLEIPAVAKIMREAQDELHAKDNVIEGQRGRIAALEAARDVLTEDYKALRDEARKHARRAIQTKERERVVDLLTNASVTMDTTNVNLRSYRRRTCAHGDATEFDVVYTRESLARFLEPKEKK